jgi:hypothetical protein
VTSINVPEILHPDHLPVVTTFSLKQSKKG